MSTTSLLLAQPLKLTDMNIKIIDDEEEEEELSLDKIIDDAELLAILGLSSQQPQVSSFNSNSLLSNSKRKHIEEEEDVFAQFDFKEAQLLYPTKKVKSC